MEVDISPGVGNCSIPSDDVVGSSGVEPTTNEIGGNVTIGANILHGIGNMLYKMW